MYKKDILRDYISNSELRVFSNNIKVRLAKELADKYDQGSYNNYLNNMQKYFAMINELGIKYPGNANPVLYIYIVPDDNYRELLRFPAIFAKGKGGGKSVKCYDLDGFNSAYGLSQNMLENTPIEESNISKIENEIHELAHIVHSQFFSVNQTICEGVAEALPLYVLGFEEIFTEHRNLLMELNEGQILSAEELLNSEKDGTYGKEAALPGRSCAFRFSYISSYLFVRGCLEVIVKNFNFSKVQAFQYFLEIVKQSNCRDEWLIFDIANALGLSEEELLTSKKIQLKALKSISLQIDATLLAKKKTISNG